MNNYQIIVQLFGGLSEEKLSNAINVLIHNGAMQQLFYYDKNEHRLDLGEVISQIRHALSLNRPPVFYAKNKNISFKIIIFNDENARLVLLPQAPFCLKKDVSSNNYVVDLIKYAQIALGFCENFPVYQFLIKPAEDL
jgi:hypothetical protein